MMGEIVIGRVVRLTYRSVGSRLTGSVMRVHLRAPDGDVYTHDLPNGHWTKDNPALQFLANWGYRPSDFEGTDIDVEDEQWTVPIAPLEPDNPESGWALAQAAFDGAERALASAEWFEGVEDLEQRAAAHAAAGGGPDGDGGGREGEKVEIEAEEEADEAEGADSQESASSPPESGDSTVEGNA